MCKRQHMQLLGCNVVRSCTATLKAMCAVSERSQLRVEAVVARLVQMTKGNVGSLLVFDPSKLQIEGGDENLKSASSEAVVGIVTERGVPVNTALWRCFDLTSALRSVRASQISGCCVSQR